MATIREYTTIEQSRKLAEILPLESADMHYWKRTWRKGDYAISVGHSKELQKGFTLKEIEYIPCWGLAALLSVLSCPTLYQQRDGAWGLDVWVERVKVYSVKNVICKVDACYEMILKLHEQKLL